MLKVKHNVCNITLYMYIKNASIPFGSQESFKNQVFMFLSTCQKRKGLKNKQN